MVVYFVQKIKRIEEEKKNFWIRAKSCKPRRLKCLSTTKFTLYVCFVFFFFWFCIFFLNKFFRFTRLFHTLDNNNCCDEICFLFYFSFLFVSLFTFRPYFVLIFLDSFIIYFDLLLKTSLRECVCFFLLFFHCETKNDMV